MLRSVVLAASVVVTVLVPVGPSSAAAYCGQVWGSQPRAGTGSSQGIDETAQLMRVRAGRHACFDRLVLDVSEPLTDWSVRYVDVLRTDAPGGPGDGSVVTVRGGARLEVTAHAQGPAGDAAFAPGRRLLGVTQHRTFRDVVQAGSTGGVTTVGLGVRARLPFRVLVLAGSGGGSRLVVDVGHRWCSPGATRC